MTEGFSFTAKQAEVAENIVTLYTKGVELLAEAHKKTLDVAQQQNTEVIGAWKKMVQGAPGASGLLDLAATTFGQYADVQRGAIDLAVEQNQRLSGLAKVTGGVTAMAQETVDCTATMQKKAIEFTTAHTKTMIDAFKRQSGVAGTPVEAVANSLQQGLETIAETQKELLNFAVKQAVKAQA